LEKQNTVFYEIRAPLNEILDMLDTLTEPDDPAKIKECLTKVNGASRELLVLINNTLDVS
jgi:signal transduction histidine kinase